MKIARAKTGVKKTQSLLRTSHILNVACLTARVKGFLRLLWGLLRVPFVCTKGGFVLYMAGGLSCTWSGPRRGPWFVDILLYPHSALTAYIGVDYTFEWA